MFTLACATDDGSNFSDKHFGDADKFYIYEITPDGSEYIETVSNLTLQCVEQEGVHGDANKAKHIMFLLKEKGVQACMNGRFGPNISRISAMFQPLVSGVADIDSALNRVCDNHDLINAEYDKGNLRKHMKIS